MREHGISNREFDDLDAESQDDWVQELVMDDYKDNRKKTRFNEIHKRGWMSIPKPQKQMLAIWEVKKVLIDKIVKKTKERRSKYEIQTPEQLTAYKAATQSQENELCLCA